MSDWFKMMHFLWKSFQSSFISSTSAAFSLRLMCLFAIWSSSGLCLVFKLILLSVGQNHWIFQFFCFSPVIQTWRFVPAEMLTDQMAAAILAATLCFAASCVWAAADCSPSPTEASGGARLLTAVVDAQRAELARRQHLEALFHRWAAAAALSEEERKTGEEMCLWSDGLEHFYWTFMVQNMQPKLN